MTSPPTCAMGSRTLVASRTNLRSTHMRSRGRVCAGKISHQPTPATATVTPRTTTTRRIPHPTLATAWPTASRPDHVVIAMTAAIPINQAATPACLTISAPSPASPGPTAGRRVVPTNRSTVRARPASGPGLWRPRASLKALLPGRFDVEGLGCARSYGGTGPRCPAARQARACNVAGQPRPCSASSSPSRRSAPMNQRAYANVTCSIGSEFDPAIS